MLEKESSEAEGNDHGYLSQSRQGNIRTNVSSPSGVKVNELKMQSQSNQNAKA
jgi:hypothetical protein